MEVSNVPESRECDLELYQHDAGPELYSHGQLAPEHCPSNWPDLSTESTGPWISGLELRKESVSKEALEANHHQAKLPSTTDEPLPIDTDEKDPKSRPRPLSFWVAVCLLVLVLVAAAVGGGIGGIAAHQNSAKLAAAQSSASAASKLATATSIITSAIPVQTPTSDCTTKAGQNWTSEHGAALNLSYTRLCNTNLDLNTSWWENYFYLTAFTFDACISSCQSYNQFRNVTDVTTVNYFAAGSAGTHGNSPGACMFSPYPHNRAFADALDRLVYSHHSQ
jgi:hypothetical protein